MGAKSNKKKDANTTQSSSGANLGFEDRLWSAADKLRGTMDAAEYKHVVLGLIFLKYISDSFLEKYEALKAEEFADLEDRDEYMADNVLWVPPEGRWDYLQKRAKDPKIGQIIDEAMSAIQRDIDGNPVSITSADGQVTTLTLDANGYLASVTNPNSEAFQMVYNAEGLMTAFTNPRSLTATVSYDALGLLDKDLNPASGFLQTARTEDADGYTVSATTALGHTSTEIVGYR